MINNNFQVKCIVFETYIETTILCFINGCENETHRSKIRLLKLSILCLIPRRNYYDLSREQYMLLIMFNLHLRL